MKSCVVIVPGWCSPKGLEWRASVIPGRLRECGFDIKLFRPCDYGTININHNAENLSEFIGDLYNVYAYDKVQVIGHSMGGLVARQADILLSDRTPSSAIDKIVTLATPHKGSPGAYLASSLPVGKAARQMCPGSRFLETLDSEAQTKSQKLSFGCRLDALVPFNYSKWDDWVPHVWLNHGHVSLLYSRKVANQIVEFLAKA